MEPSQVGFIDLFLEGELIDKHILGYIGEWDMSGGDLIEHKVHDGGVYVIALNGDKIATFDDDHNVIRVFGLSSCMLVFFKILLNDWLRCS